MIDEISPIVMTDDEDLIMTDDYRYITRREYREEQEEIQRNKEFEIQEKIRLEQEEIQAKEDQKEMEIIVARHNKIEELVKKAKEFKERYFNLIAKEDKESLLQIEKDSRKAFLDKNAESIFIFTMPSENTPLYNWCLFELGLSDSRVDEMDKQLDMNIENYHSTLRMPSFFPDYIKNHKNVKRWIKARKNPLKREMHYNFSSLLEACPDLPKEILEKELNLISFLPVWILNLRQKYAKWVNDRRMKKLEAGIQFE